MRRRAPLAAVAACALLAGIDCTPGVRWRDFTFAPVYEAAQRDAKLTFVYFRHWAVVACTDFEEHVLKQAAVRTATESLYCVPLDVILDRDLADSWHVSAVPAYVILGPDRHVLAMREGEITAEQVLGDIERSVAAAGLSPESAPQNSTP